MFWVDMMILYRNGKYNTFEIDSIDNEQINGLWIGSIKNNYCCRVCKLNKSKQFRKVIILNGLLSFSESDIRIDTICYSCLKLKGSLFSTEIIKLNKTKKIKLTNKEQNLNFVREMLVMINMLFPDLKINDFTDF